MEYEFNTLAKKYQSLPEDLRQAMSSTDTIEMIRDIAEDHGLLIDQTGELIELTSLVMLGLIPSKNFVSELSKRAEIKTMVAEQIAKEINSQVFAGIRESLRKMEASAEDNDADLDHAGNLSVEKATPDQASSDSMNRANILDTIESTENHPNLPINVLNPVTTASPAVSLINRLMAAPTATANETVEKIAPATATSASIQPSMPPAAPKPPAATSPTPSSRPGSDPYREPIE